MCLIFTTDSRHYSSDGILYIVMTGVQWRMLPSDFAPRQTVYYYSTSGRTNEISNEHNCFTVTFIKSIYVLIRESILQMRMSVKPKTDACTVLFSSHLRRFFCLFLCIACGARKGHSQLRDSLLCYMLFCHQKNPECSALLTEMT